MIVILAIETSCDDTSASVCVDGTIRSNVIYSQKIHEEFGGVVPELASRSHENKITYVVEKALKDAKISKSELTAIGYTRGPGLIGSLVVGVSFAKGMAMGLGIPMIEVNHMQAHVLANMIGEDKPSFPFVCLTVSGGHTQLVYVNDYLDMKVVGTTIDDAAGEAFDKTAKMLGLEYPGGPLIDRFAQNGDPLKYSFARPKINGLDFSFSGLKTSVLYFLQKQQQQNPLFVEQEMHHLCASIQHTIVDILIDRLKDCLKEYPSRHIAIAGGVSANSYLRKKIEEFAQRYNLKHYIPKFEYCTDNAAMIAIVAHYKYQKSQFSSLDVEPITKKYAF